MSSGQVVKDSEADDTTHAEQDGTAVVQACAGL